MIIHDWFDTWIETYVQPCRAHSTTQGYSYALNRLTSSFLAENMGAVTVFDCQREINRIASTTPRQAQICLVAMRQAFSRAVHSGLMDHNPAAEVERPRAEKRDIVYLTGEQLIAFLRAASDLPSYRAFLLMAIMGLRRGEALALTYGDIKENHARITRQIDARGNMQPLKTHASRRTLPVPEDLRRLLGEGTKTQRVCSVEQHRLYKDMRCALEKAQLPHVTPHGLRHTFASMAIHEGIPMRVLQSLMGHAHFAVTADTYSHIYRPDMDAAGEKIATAILCEETRLEIV